MWHRAPWNWRNNFVPISENKVRPRKCNFFDNVPNRNLALWNTHFPMVLNYVLTHPDYHVSKQNCCTYPKAHGSKMTIVMHVLREVHLLQTHSSFLVLSFLKDLFVGPGPVKALTCLQGHTPERKNTLEEVTFFSKTLSPATFYTSLLLSPQQPHEHIVW